MKAIVHIGTEKTGTTSIQNFLYLNQRKLKIDGFHFIQSAGKMNNRALPAYCMRDDLIDDFFRDEGIRTLEEKNEYKRKFIVEFENEIRAAPADVHTFIMSSEHFHSRIRSEAEMDNVYKLLSAYFDEIKIVCYLREQVDTCTSYYSTHLKTGGTTSFAGFLQRCKPDNYYFNYYEMLANWERCFGFESLDVSLFAKNHFLNGDLLDDFTAKIDPALVGSLNKSIQAENESLKPIGQALARAINIIFPVSTTSAEVNDIRNKCKNGIIKGLTGRGQQPELTIRKSIFDNFIESNEQVRQKYFPEINTLFEPPVELAEPEYKIDEDDFDAIVDFFNALRIHGKTAISTEKYGEVIAAIVSCINDFTSGVSDVNMGGTDLIFNQDDVYQLLFAARSIQGRKPTSAYKLLAIANKMFPQSRGIKEKMEDFRLKSEQPPKSQYIVIYHVAGTSLNRDDEQKMSEFHHWLASLDVPEGSPLMPLASTNTVYSDRTVSDAVLSRVGFSIFRAYSLDEAITKIKSCPLLDLGVNLEVSEFGQKVPAR